MSGLIRTADELEPGVVAVDCVKCGRRYSADEFRVMELCYDCNCGGFIPRRIPRVEDRFPPELASRFTPLPEALMDHADALNIGPHELLVVWALERHRRVSGDEVWPSRQTLQRLTRLSRGQVTRAIGKLRPLLNPYQPRFNSGRHATNRYTLDFLWSAVADLERGVEPSTVAHQWATVNSEKADKSAANATVAHQWATDRGSPANITVAHQWATEVDTEEEDAFFKESPVGTSSRSERRDDPPLYDTDQDEPEGDDSRYRDFMAWKDEHAPNAKVTPALWRRFTEQERQAA